MTPRAQEILEVLNAARPDVIFEWTNKDWPHGDDSPCIITATLRNDPSKTESMHHDNIGEQHSIADLVDGIISHLVPVLEK